MRAILALAGCLVGCHYIAGLDQPVDQNATGASSASAGAGGNADCPLACALGPVHDLDIGTTAPTSPALVWSGIPDRPYGLAWEGDFVQRRIFFERLDENGTPASDAASPIFDEGQAILPSMTWADGRYVITWQQTLTDNDHTEVHFLDVGPDGALGADGSVVYGAARYAEAPSVAWMLGGFGVAFEEGQRVYLALRDGGMAGGQDKQLGEDVSSHAASIAVDGEVFVVVWREEGTNTRLYHRSMTKDGLSTSAGLPANDMAADGAMPSLAVSRDGKQAIAWDADAGGDGKREIYFQILGEQYSEVWGGQSATEPQLVAGPDCWAVAWTVNDLAGLHGIYLQLLEPDGTSRDMPTSLTSQDEVMHPSLVWNGVGFSLVWVEGARLRFAKCEMP